jgi:hypothetical protein
MGGIAVGSLAGRRGFLLVRRAGGLWGIASSAVASLTRRDGTFRIGVGGGADGGVDGETSILADEIVAVVEELQVQPAAGVLHRFWGEAADGIALHGVLPLVVVDPHHPPRALREKDQEGVVNEGRG